jgi:hypothetical protein
MRGRWECRAGLRYLSLSGWGSAKAFECKSEHSQSAQAEVSKPHTNRRAEEARHV